MTSMRRFVVFNQNAAWHVGRLGLLAMAMVGLLGMNLALAADSSVSATGGAKSSAAPVAGKPTASGGGGKTGSSLNNGPQVKARIPVQSHPTILQRVPIKSRP